MGLLPVQIGICTITSDADDVAVQVLPPRRKKRGLRVETDVRNGEKINYKVREHSLAKVPVLVAFGRKEASENTVSPCVASAPTHGRRWAPRKRSTRWQRRLCLQISEDRTARMVRGAGEPALAISESRFLPQPTG